MTRTRSQAAANAQLETAATPKAIVFAILQLVPAVILAIVIMGFKSDNPPWTSPTCLTPAQLNCTTLEIGLTPTCYSAQDAEIVAKDWRTLLDNLKVTYMCVCDTPPNGQPHASVSPV